MEYENNNQVIFLKDLVFAVLYRWKIILVAILIGALLLGGLQYISNSKSTPATPSQAETFKMEQLRQQIEIKDAAITNQISYMKHSVLMNLDPYNVHQVSIAFYIHTDYQILPDMAFQNPNSIAILLDAYRTLANDGKLIEQIAQETGIDTQYVAELIFCEVNTDSNPGLLTVTAIHSNPETASKIATLVKNHLVAASNNLNEQVDAHTLNTIDIVSGKRTNPQLATTQKQNSDQLSALQADRTKLQTELNKISTPTLPTSPILMALIGGFLGACLVAGIAFVAHLCSTKVYSGRTLVNHTGVKLITRIGKKPCKNPIDRWLKKLEGRPAGDFLEQTALVTAYLRAQGAEQILLTGDGSAEDVNKIAQALSASGLQAIACGSILRDPVALDMLSQATTVLLVEQSKRSVYRNIEQEMAIIKDTGKTLLGCVLLDI